MPRQDTGSSGTTLVIPAQSEAGRPPPKTDIWSSTCQPKDVVSPSGRNLGAFLMR